MLEDMSLFRTFVSCSLFTLTIARCPCEFDPVKGEVSCLPETQTELPWFLPSCLDTIQYDEVRKKDRFKCVNSKYIFIKSTAQARDVYGTSQLE